MSIEGRINRALDRLWGWFLWQLGVIQGKARAGEPGGFRPSFSTGALVLAAFAYQVVSGGLLLLYYQPSVYPTLTACGQAAGLSSSAPAAWCSTFYIDHSVPFGSVLLTSHLYGAYVLIFLALLHLFRGFYAGAYKQPGGKFSWMAGTLLLVLVLGMGFTGYLLVYTQLSYNATQVSITLLQSLPVVGPPLANLLVGDGLPQSLLSRMFALHVILLPVALVVIVFLHKRSTLFPNALGLLVKWGLLYVGLLLGFASLWVWSLPTYAGDLTGAPAATVPEWYFLWVFKLLDFANVTPEYAMIFAAALFLFLFFLPLLDRSGFSHPRDRPVFLFLGNSLIGFFILMTAWGDLAPGVPISGTEAALRLGPILGVNAVAVGLFYRRYRISSRPARAAGSRARKPRVIPPPDGSTVGGGPGPGRPAPVLSPTLFSVAGLAAALFVLAFGLLLPFLFLLGAFLVHLAESARSSSGNRSRSTPRDWVFPTVAFLSTLAFLGALVLTVAL